MAQALVVSDNEVLNGLYAVNLDVYLATSTSAQDNIDQAIKLIELNPNFDVIICLCLIDGRDAAVEISAYLKQQRLDIPMVVIGRQSEIDPNLAVILPASFNIKTLVKSCAKILGITAKDMAEKPVPTYYPIPLKVFFNLDLVHTDVYYKVKKGKYESEYLMILSKGSRVWPRMKKYQEEGVRFLHIDSKERLKFVNNASEKIIEVLENTEISNEEKIEVLEQGIEIVTEQMLNSEDASVEIQNISKVCIKTVTDVVKDIPKLGKLLSALVANKSGYLYAHSMLTTYVSNHIVRKISWGGDSHVEKLNFVLFFHDMFLVQIYNRHPEAKYEEELIFSDQLDDKEKEVILNHAMLAGEMIQKFPQCPMGADQLIKQHHGVTNGVGFAVKYRDDISPLAKVILVAEHFVEEIYKNFENGGTFSKPYTLNLLKERYNKSSYTKIIETLESLEI